MIFVFCLILCSLSFVGGLALGLPSPVSEPHDAATAEPDGVESGRTHNAAANVAGVAAGRQVAKPIAMLSDLTRSQVSRAGAALKLPPGANPAGLVNAEVDRQERSADPAVAAVNEAVQERIATTKRNAAAPAGAQALFTLELGAFHAAAEAQQFARAVLDHGWPVEIAEESGADGTTVSRVRSGRFADRALAAEMQQTIESQAGLGATIVPLAPG